MNFTNCPYCKGNTLYSLKNDYIKCKECNKKFSPKKLEIDLVIIEYFCDNYHALDTSKILKLNYRTVQHRYKILRQLCGTYLEDVYQNSIHDDNSYEEHYYFTQRDKLKKIRSIYNSINIIGFYSNKKVYTLLMPQLPKPSYTKEDKNFEKYLHWHKLYSHDGYVSPLKEFWSFLEEQMKKYKGISKQNFFYYLKECEFKYNYSRQEQQQILKEIYF